MAFDSKEAVGIITLLFVAGIMGAFLFPVAINEMSGPETETVTQNVSDTVELQPNLTITLDSTSAGSNATYTVDASGDTATTTVNVGSNQTVTVDGEDVTIALTEANTGNATADVTYPSTYGWGPGASAIWAILPLILVLALFLYITFVAVKSL